MAREAKGPGDGTTAEELERLIGVLPSPLQDVLRSEPIEGLVDVVLDLGRSPEAHFATHRLHLDDAPVGSPALEHVLAQIGEFTEDNRAGIEGTLHRISAIRNRRGQVVGLTLRVGRTLFGTIDTLADLVQSGRNILLLGPPGVGKTTKLREISRVLSVEAGRRVMVIDTSNEIAGDGDVPHPAIGSARRMQVRRPDLQHAVMIEAVENHTPQVIIVDEIGTEAEAAAARTIAERGVQLIATAHGNTLENLVLNPTLSDLVGGVATVTLGDEEARRRRTPKTISERRAPPTFDVLVEIVSYEEVLVRPDVADAVDHLLAGRPVAGERRVRSAEGTIEVRDETPAPAFVAEMPHRGNGAGGPDGPARILTHGVSRHLVERVLKEIGADARVVDRPDAATMIVTLRSRESDPRIQRLAERGNLPIHTVKRNSAAQLRRMLQSALHLVGGVDPALVRDAAREVEHAIQRVLAESVPVALAPRRSSVRRMQHQMVTRYGLIAESVGSEPMRHLVIQPGD